MYIYNIRNSKKSNTSYDVQESFYYYDAVLWALEKGITTGVTETTFDAFGICDRGRMFTFLYRSMN